MVKGPVVRRRSLATAPGRVEWLHHSPRAVVARPTTVGRRRRHRPEVNTALAMPGTPRCRPGRSAATRGPLARVVGAARRQSSLAPRRHDCAGSLRRLASDDRDRAGCRNIAPRPSLRWLHAPSDSSAWPPNISPAAGPSRVNTATAVVRADHHAAAEHRGTRRLESQWRGSRARGTASRVDRAIRRRRRSVLSGDANPGAAGGLCR